MQIRELISLPNPTLGFSANVSEICKFLAGAVFLSLIFCCCLGDEGLTVGGYFEGDIAGINSENVEEAVKKVNYWPGGVVPFETISNFHIETVQPLYEAIAELKNKTCIKLVPAQKSDPDFVFFTNGGDKTKGCSSYVGRQGGLQEVIFGAGCNTKGQILHQIMHTLGFWHEHSRDDRDEHIKINWNNLDEPAIHHGGEPFDTHSVMILPPNAFAKSSVQVTMSLVNGKQLDSARNHLSEGDVRKINQVYCTAWQKTDAETSSKRVKRSKSYESQNPETLYAASRSLRLTEAQQKLLNETLKLPYGGMIGAPEIMQLNMNLMRAVNAKRVIDVGLFTGFSALAAAMVVPSNGQVIGIDITDSFFNNIGKAVFEKEGLLNKLDLRIMENAGIKVLDDLIASNQSGQFDFCFIDADKANYPSYYEKCLTLLRPGGFITLDNALLGGQVLEASKYDLGNYVRIMEDLNVKISKDERVHPPTFLTLGDGLMIVMKK